MRLKGESVPRVSTDRLQTCRQTRQALGKRQMLDIPSLFLSVLVEVDLPFLKIKPACKGEDKVSFVDFFFSQIYFLVSRY